MDSTQIFMSNTSNARKSLFGNNREEVLVLKIEGAQISGKGYVCNEEGKNGYIDEFSFPIKEIDDISVEQYNKSDALKFSAQIKSLYGAKKIKVYLPNIKNVEIAMGELRKVKRDFDKGLIPVTTAQKAEETKTETEAVVATDTVKTSEIVSEPKEATEKKTEMTKEEFKRRMDKLSVLKDCGLLEEKEFVAKKLELISELYDLKEFNEKLQKIIALKECGLLSDKEFDANRLDLIKECCDLDEADTEQYKRNIQKLSFMQIGDVISEAEYEKTKMILVRDVEFDLDDSNELFISKLQRLPILKECQIIDQNDYDDKIAVMYEMLEVSKTDTREDLVNKLKKWPALVQEKYMEADELKNKQNQIITGFLDVEWETPGELKSVIIKMTDLKEGECLTEEEYKARREKILKGIDEVDDYTIRVTMYKLLPQLNFITSEEYAALKKKCIDQIFSKSGSVEEFKVRANNLVELQKVGILTDKELAEYKVKLMSEL